MSVSTNTVLDQRIAERDQTIAAARALAESEEFNPEDPTFVDLQTRATELDARIASLSAVLDQQQSGDAFSGKLAKAAQERQRQDQLPALQTRESWGEAWIRSEQMAGYRGRGTSGIFEIEDGYVPRVQTRALPTGLADLVTAGFKGVPYQVDTTPPAAPTPLLNNITTVQVSGNAVEFVAWSHDPDPGATKVDEKAGKPSTEFSPDVTSDTLDTFAVYTQLTRQLIEDLPSVRDMVDQELRRDVSRAIENDAAAVLAAATLPTASGSDLLAAIRVGIAEVQGKGYNPTGILMNPADWADLDNTVMGATLNGPVVRQSFWGLTVIPSAAQPAGVATVGDLRSAVMHFYRSAVALYVTDSHADTFVKNVFTLLAEARGLTAVVRPQALCECSG